MYQKLLNKLTFALTASLVIADAITGNEDISDAGDCGAIIKSLPEDIAKANIFGCEVNDGGKLKSILIENHSLNNDQVKNILSYNTIESLKYWYIDTNGTVSQNIVFPPEIGQLANLKELDISYNKEDGNGNFSPYTPTEKMTFPTSLKSLEVDSINVNYNDIQPLTQLESLNIIFTSKELNNEDTNALKSLTNLKSLEISDPAQGRNLHEIPEFVYSLNNLEELRLCTQGIGALPERLFALTNLKAIAFSGNGMGGTIPESICKLTKLEYIDLSFNSFNGELPNCVNSLGNLTSINLESNNNLGGKLSSNSLQEFNCENTNVDVDENMNCISGSIKSSTVSFTALISFAIILYFI